ncbi:hypothetical protein BWI15_19950 [Kribbella sp. ALI-6-A]|nr:hypothetical protein BWI15_19950 [Kribbella sp. ALI-6-A]
MADELPWAMTSVRVFATGLSGDEIAGRLALAATQAAADRWIRDVRGADDESLDGQLEELTRVLAELETRVGQLPDRDVDVLISWSPQVGQDHAGFGVAGEFGTVGGDPADRHLDRVARPSTDGRAGQRLLLVAVSARDPQDVAAR